MDKNQAKAEKKALNKVMTKTEFKNTVTTAAKSKLKKMGFRVWGEKYCGKDLYLIPKSLYGSIPEGFLVTDIFGKTERFSSKTSDNDARFGCLAYGVVR